MSNAKAVLKLQLSKYHGFNYLCRLPGWEMDSIGMDSLHNILLGANANNSGNAKPKVLVA